jgi:hypothetical protein
MENKRKDYRVLVEKTRSKKPIGKHMTIHEVKMKINVKEI